MSQERDERDRQSIRQIVARYATKRKRFYSDIALDKLLSKDVLMFALRGASDADQYVDMAFAALESSSEETVMGNVWQEIALELAQPAVTEAGDMLAERDGILWAVEVKTQTNTLNARSKMQTIRVLKDTVERHSREQTVRRRKVKAVIGVIRGKSRDSFETYDNPPTDTANPDLDGFCYRYLVGASFWKWLTGRDDISGLFTGIVGGESALLDARSAAISRLKQELNDKLSAAGHGSSISDVMALANSRS